MRVTKTCPVCGKEFEPTGNRQKYCGENCRRRANRNTGNIKKHTKSFWERVEIYDHFHYRCAICGWEIPIKTDRRGQRNSSHGCEIHHIVPVSEGGGWDADNIILLCPNCHKKADFGIISQEELKIVLRQFDKTREYFFEVFNELSIPNQDKCLRYMSHLEAKPIDLEKIKGERI